MVGLDAVLVHNDCEADLEGLQHMVDRRTVGGKGVDPDNDALGPEPTCECLPVQPRAKIGVRQDNGSIAYRLQSSGVIGVVSWSKLSTTQYSVIRDQCSGDPLTMHPGW